MNLRTAFGFAPLFFPVWMAACGAAQPAPAAPPNPTSASSAPESSASAPAPGSAAPSASAAPTASASSAPAASAAPPGPPGPGDWDKWSHDERLAYMKSTVMPKMAAVFHDYDPKTFEEPKCVLCHGPGVKDGSFTMPNPELPKLDLSPAGMKATHGKKAKVVEFMMKQVVPTMAQLLGEPPFDPKTRQGFGCLDCHTKK